ncbi:MAG TPA: efflux RND transporter permease subunit [Thermoanaerobaculia bacterium]|nr:efflux RND transporter permease subunit [Thermoanaerobaculia bacterium]
MSGPSRWEGALPRFSLDRRITVLVLLASALVVGTVATLGIPLELFPRGFNLPHLAVQVPWRDAPPEEVLEKIVIPLEEELATVRGLERINSVATTGFGRAFLLFKQGTDMDVAYREVRDRVERARARLPEDADRVFIRKEDETGIPIAVLGLAVDPALTDSYNLIQKEIVLPLQRIDGVATVGADGLGEKEILIELDRKATESAGLNIYQLGLELAGDSFTLASGNVRSGGDKLLLRSVARYPDLEALQNRPIGTVLRLKDIATVRYAEPEKKYRARANSRPAVALIILKEGDANTLQVSREIAAAISRMKANPRLRQIELVPLFDQGEVILDSLENLVGSGLLGGLIAIAVLFFFLGRLRMTLIITLSMPLSLVIALAVMYFAGESLNIISLLGLMISVGMLVDNSVVVAENILRLRGEGLSRREASIRGAGEIALAILMATLTTVTVFLPVSLVEGEGQFFLLRLAIPISVSLLASLLVALVCVPLAVYLTLPASGAEAEAKPWRKRFDAGLASAYDHTFGLLNRAYGRLLALSLRHRLDVVVALVAVLALTGWVAQEKIEVKPTQEDEGRGFEIDVDLPDNTTLEEAEQYFLTAEKVVQDMKGELDLAGYFLFHRATRGEIQGWFNQPRTNDLTPRQVTERILAALPEKPGAELFTGQEEEDQDEDESLYTLTLAGEDAQELEKTARQLEARFARVPGVLGIKKAGERSPNELALVIDRDRAQRQGVNPEVVAGVVGYALRGQALPRYSQDGKEIPVRVRFREADRESLADLSSFEVPTMTGETVALSSLTDIELLPTATRIERENQRISRTITTELREGQEDAAREGLEALAAGFDLPEGIVTVAEEEDEGLDEDMEGMVFASALSIVFIYLLMGLLFESFILPLSIILTIPLAGIGVVWLHVLAGLNLDILGFVGAVLLIGVVVNNGIVLIDYVNRLREDGHERAEALLLATKRRFRPIMMTALTTICGMIPLTFGGTNQIGLSYTSFGLTLIGGMTTATLLTLLVVPVFYTFFDDAREAVGRALRRGAEREEMEAAGTTS